MIYEFLLVELLLRRITSALGLAATIVINVFYLAFVVANSVKKALSYMFTKTQKVRFITIT